MAITVKDIQEKEFSKQVRGYNIDEVDDFLDQVAKQLESLIRENRAYMEKAEAAAHGSVVQVAVAPRQSVIPVPPTQSTQLQPVTAPDAAVSAPQNAPALINEPQYFKNLEATVRETLINAQRIADDTIAEARKKANTAIASAEEQATAIVSTAKVEAESVRVESDELRKATDEYRSRFMRLIEDQLHVLKADNSLFE